MGIFTSIRERIGNVMAAVIGAIVLLGLGLLFLLVLAPKQKLEAIRIEALPLMDASSVTYAAAGDEILVTGRLSGRPLPGTGSFIAYTLEEWDVTPADPNDPEDEPSGTWKNVEWVIPNLDLDIQGSSVQILASSEAYLNGDLHEEFEGSGSFESAEYMGDSISDGSLRYRGFYDGDLTTVLGTKASVGGVIPKELFAGDRVTFVSSQHSAAKGLMIAGIFMLVCSPVVLVGGVLSALFGRRRGRRL